jgi:hypothetical protein
VDGQRRRQWIVGVSAGVAFLAALLGMYWWRAAHPIAPGTRPASSAFVLLPMAVLNTILYLSLRQQKRSPRLLRWMGACVLLVWFCQGMILINEYR